MKKLLYLILAMLSGISLSACSMNNDATENTTEQLTPNAIEYSYADLKAVQNDIDDYFESFDEEGARNDKICQVTNRISIVDGYVEVNLKEITDDIIKLFKERVSDSDAIKFKQGPPGHEDSDQK